MPMKGGGYRFEQASTIDLRQKCVAIGGFSGWSAQGDRV